MIKLLAIAALLAAFLGLFVFGPFYQHLWVQLGVFVAAMAWNSIRSSLKDTFALLRSTLPFMATLLLFGLIFQVVRLQGREDWLYDSALKCLLFPSSVVYLRVLLSYVTYLDILGLPISMHRRFQLITAKAAFQKGAKYLGRFSWYLDTYPYLRSDRAMKRALMKYASLIISLYLYLYEETENAYLLLQNRYRHLKEERECKK